MAAHTAGGVRLRRRGPVGVGPQRPRVGAELGERRIMLGTIAEPRKRRSMVGESENKLRVEEDRVNLRKRLFPALG